jgi:hypothetical protein
MVLTGIMFIILGIVIFIFSLLNDKLTENGKILWHWVSGFIICYGLFGTLPPIKLPKNTDINVQTKQVPEVKKEIFVNNQGKSDTTYYYMFTNSSVVGTVE